MTSTNTKLLLASTALVAVVGSAQAADTSLAVSGALNSGTGQLVLDSGTDAAVAAGDVISVAGSSIVAELSDADNTTGPVIDLDVAGVTLNIDANLTYDNNVANNAGVVLDVTAGNANTTINVDGGVTLENTSTNAAAHVINVATGQQATMNIHGNLVADGGGTGNAINAAADTSLTLNVAGDVTGGVVLGNNTNAVTLTNGMTLTGVLTGGTGTDTLTVGDASISDSSGTIAYSAGTVNVTGAVSGFETINVTAGTLDADAAVSGATTVTVSEGATLDIASTLAATTANVNGTLVTAGSAITGDVNLGATGGNATVTGAFLLGASGHTVTSNGATFSSNVTGGAGADTFVQAASTTDITGNFDNIETVNVTGGTLEVGGTFGATDLDDVTVSSGATLDVTGAADVDNNFWVSGTYNALAAGTTVGNDVSITGTATYLETGLLTVGNDLTIASGASATIGDIAVTGDAAISGEFNLTAAAGAIGGALNVSSTARVDLDQDLVVTGALTVDSGADFTVGDGTTLTAATGAASLGNLKIEVNNASSGLVVLTGGDNIDLSSSQPTVVLTQGVDLSTLDGDFFDDMISGGAAATSTTAGNITTGNAIFDYVWSIDGSDANDWDLTVNLKNTGVTTLAGAAAAGNNTSVATVIDSAALSDLYTAVLNVADTDSALESLTPDVSGGAAAAGVNTAVASAGTVSNRLALLRGTDNGRSGAVAGDKMHANRGMWLQAFGTDVDQDARDGVEGFEATSGGFAIGVDTDELVRDARVGVAFSYAVADVESDAANNAETDIDTYQLSVYGSRDFANDIYVDAMVSYAWNEHEGDRTDFLGDTYESDYDGEQFSIKAEVGKAYEWANTRVTPNFGLHYINIETDSYNETGAGANGLSVDSDDVSAFLISLGADVEWNHTGRDGSEYRPYLRAKYAFDAMSEEVETTSSFLGGGTAFVSEGADIEEHSITLGAGVNVLTTGGFEFTAGYDAEIKEDFLAHTGVLQARWSF